VTPSIDLNAAREHARVDRIAEWNDGVGPEWRSELPGLLGGAVRTGVEFHAMPPLVRQYVDSLVSGEPVDIAPLVSSMRMVKTEAELNMARHAGAVAGAMMQAGREAIAHDVPEYEVALATAEAGTRMAAEILEANYEQKDMSPNIHFLQIMASGRDVIKTHHRATTRKMQRGEPVFLCFCGMTSFHRFKLGFDRTFWIGDIADRSQEKVYQVAVDSQAAALDILGPGVSAEKVHAAYAEVIQGAGYEFPFRCGRGTGFSYLESPQLVSGDDTVLEPGMVFAVDGSVSTADFRAQVGDSFIITEEGYEAITHHPKSVDEVIIAS